MTIKDFFSFKENKYFWVNLIGMIAVAFILLTGLMKGLDIYTRHGEAVLVPDAKGMTVEQAKMLFRNRGLLCIVADSSYEKDKPAGCVIDHNPAGGQKVKEGRTIYLTINTLNIPLRLIPDVADNSSVRQAQARILAVGFKLSEDEPVSGEKDWVYGVKYNGRQILPGDKAPIGATLTLMVGDGTAQDSIENVEADSLDNTKKEVDAPATDDSWF
ncbi:PASTA domain-containing protein [uncultured Bacteroides sp.]|uniref:PASTA domain-containing protein n=1 Tax=uncultured Bacteroides sp. TaxID=162156 RepID=UPI002AA936E3|nr:PASTA domain-containing protein [uncultured Bacteroides sp.]